MPNLTQEWLDQYMNSLPERMKGGDAPCQTITSPTCRETTPSLSNAAPASKSAGAHTPNKWEEAYMREVLEPRRIVGEIYRWRFEAIHLRLAERTYYIPDFAVAKTPEASEFLRNVEIVKLLPCEDGGPLDGLEIVEIKGHLRDDARDRFKIAADRFPFRFTMLRKKAVKEGGGWEVMRDLNVPKGIGHGI